MTTEHMTRADFDAMPKRYGGDLWNPCVLWFRCFKDERVTEAR
jgi:hypothetical protein